MITMPWWGFLLWFALFTGGAYLGSAMAIRKVRREMSGPPGKVG